MTHDSQLPRRLLASLAALAFAAGLVANPALAQGNSGDDKKTGLERASQVKERAESRHEEKMKAKDEAKAARKAGHDEDDVDVDVDDDGEKKAKHKKDKAKGGKKGKHGKKK